MAQIRYVNSDFSQTALEKAILSNWNSLMNKFSKTPTFQRIETPAQIIMISGSSIPMLNRVIRTRLNEENVDQIIYETIELFRRRKAPFHWQTQPEDTPISLPRRLAEKGFIIDEDPGMAIDLDKIKMPNEVPGFRFERVNDPESLVIFCEYLISWFGFPSDVLETFTDIHMSIGIVDDYRHYIGYLNDVPVATSSVLLADGVAGLYMVTTKPEARGHGIGSLITVTSLLEARDLGYRVGILHSSKMGYNVYLRLGFKEYCKLTGYILNI